MIAVLDDVVIAHQHQGDPPAGAISAQRQPLGGQRPLDARGQCSTADGYLLWQCPRPLARLSGEDNTRPQALKNRTATRTSTPHQASVAVSAMPNPAKRHASASTSISAIGASQVRTAGSKADPSSLTAVAREGVWRGSPRLIAPYVSDVRTCKRVGVRLWINCYTCWWRMR